MEAILRGINILSPFFPNPQSGSVNFYRHLSDIVYMGTRENVAYPLGIKGVVVGQGDTYEEALADVQSAIRFHVENFGESVLDVEPPVLEAFIAEAQIV